MIALNGVDPRMIANNLTPLIGIQADYNMQTLKKNKSFSERLEKIQKVAVML